jgi:hypothetical protein
MLGAPLAVQIVCLLLLMLAKCLKRYCSTLKMNGFFLSFFPSSLHIASMCY